MTSQSLPGNGSGSSETLPVGWEVLTAHVSAELPTLDLWMDRQLEQLVDRFNVFITPRSAKVSLRD